MPLNEFDPRAEADRICRRLRADIHHRFRLRGAVVGVSGGVDSSVVLGLCAKALGPDRVLALVLPEKESSPDSIRLAQRWADQLGVSSLVEDVTHALEGAGCYSRRDQAIRDIFPEYGEGWTNKVTLPGSLLEDDTLNFFYLTVIGPDGESQRSRLSPDQFWHITAATDMKQRTRMIMLYYHAERNRYAVVGTGNRNEHDLGFFVKYGDGGVDIAPIRHLLKSQVYALAEYLDVSEEIRLRPPTSDTYSAETTQEEFFFRLPFEALDGIWARWEAGESLSSISSGLSLSPGQVERIVDDIHRKHRTTAYLRAPIVGYSLDEGENRELTGGREEVGGQATNDTSSDSP